VRVEDILNIVAATTTTYWVPKSEETRAIDICEALFQSAKPYAPILLILGLTLIVFSLAKMLRAHKERRSGLTPTGL
jgi:hypothetical protein